ncbi:MAG: (2Fe-2S) ferredoxin domain-containing protein [Angelakisella sp.]|nr:(2Fe-2S) ferredoxin domain-containing protein [Angelakisella sp.]
MKITVCIGSSCHLKGSKQIVESLQYLISQHGLKEQIELAGTFCMGKCETGVHVTIDGKDYSVSPETVKNFFEQEVLPKL